MKKIIILSLCLLLGEAVFAFMNVGTSGTIGWYCIEIRDHGKIPTVSPEDFYFCAVRVGTQDSVDITSSLNEITIMEGTGGRIFIDIQWQEFKYPVDGLNDVIRIVLIQLSTGIVCTKEIEYPELEVLGYVELLEEDGIDLKDGIVSDPIGISINNVNLCPGEKGKEIKTQVIGTTDYTILWPDGITPKAGEKSVGIVDADAYSEGVNELTLQVNSGARMATVDFTVTVQPAPEKPQIDIESNPVLDVSSLSFKVVNESFRQGCNYQWFINNGLLENGSAHFKYGGLKEGDIVMCKAKDGQCDSGSESNKLTVNRSMLSGQSDEACFVPNLITPNGDGLNDTWQIDWLVSWPDYLLTIYNGQGKIVYRTNHYKNDWEGRIGGKLSYGVYTYTIDLHNGTVLQSWLFVKAQ